MVGMKTLAVRVGICVLLLVIGSLFSWWLMVIATAVAAFFIPNFFEVTSIGLVYDIVFNVPNIPWYIFGLHTVILILVVIIMTIIQHSTRRPNTVYSL